jgi:hypothetical protein
MGAGDFDGAESAFADAIERAEAVDDELTRWRAIAQRTRLRAQMDVTVPPTCRALADAVVAALEPRGDDLGLAKAWLLRTDVHNWQMEGASFEAAAERVVQHARRAGAVREENEGISWVGTALIFGPRPVSEGIARCEQLLDAAPGRWGEAATLVALGVLRMMNGELDGGRELYRRGHEILRELGMRLWDAGIVNASGYGELVAGDPKRAEALLRRGYEELAAMGEVGWIADTAEFLARALCDQRRYQETDEFWNVADALAKSHPLYPATGGGVHARMLAARGEIDDGLALLRRVLEVMGSTDMPGIRADAYADQADVFRLAGMRDRQAAALSDAIALYEQKGVIPAVARTRALLDGLEGTTATTS